MIDIIKKFLIFYLNNHNIYLLNYGTLDTEELRMLASEK